MCVFIRKLSQHKDNNFYSAKFPFFSKHDSYSNSIIQEHWNSKCRNGLQHHKGFSFKGLGYCGSVCTIRPQRLPYTSFSYLILPPFHPFHRVVKRMSDEVITVKYDFCGETKREHRVGGVQSGRKTLPLESAAANNRLT